MAKERVGEKDGKGKKAMTDGRKVHKKGENNGTRERARSPRT
jgi:hypothetical protein